MTLFTRSLWPETVRSPYRRLAVAMIVSPAVLSILLSVIALILAGMSEQTGEAVATATIDSAVTLTIALFLYTLTFGTVGVGILWARAERSPVAWAAAGLVGGALAGVFVGEVGMGTGSRALVIFMSVTSVALFLLIRGIAGIQDVESDA